MRRLSALAALGATAIALIIAACDGNGEDASDTPTVVPDETAAVTPAATAADDETALIVYEARIDNITNVFTINPATGETAQLTDGNGYDGQPAWSPDRSRIIFISDRGNTPNITDIYSMAPDGSDVRRLTDTPDTAERSPKWSPDGSRIVTVLSREEGYWLGLLSPEGTDEEVVAGPYRFIEFPAWTRDGSEIYIAAIGDETQGIDILAVDAETREVSVRISTPSNDVCPHFTHDGLYMTYARASDGANSPPDIFLHDLASGDTTGASDMNLTDSDASDDYANPSPDDSTFVFISNRDNDFELYLMDRDGSNQRRLTTTPNVKENVPDW